MCDRRDALPELIDGVDPVRAREHIRRRALDGKHDRARAHFRKHIDAERAHGAPERPEREVGRVQVRGLECVPRGYGCSALDKLSGTGRAECEAAHAGEYGRRNRHGDECVFKSESGDGGQRPRPSHARHGTVEG